MTERPVTPSQPSRYRVLARKYRPVTFSDLIGQEAMVRILTNAFLLDRVPHAFILTGVRGVGKTTTARIIARALNCVGPDGTGGPTPNPCGVCEHCIAIAQDRHVDVMEMDAATRTGIDDIRELVEGVRYHPVSARTKVYIIDEVHMLSRQAFNGLLKTLEEPPQHVAFIFATTEIRKVPVTVLSRCMRFDLRRVDQSTLERHFAHIALQEGVEAGKQALAIIARAADGSVRDGLSLLDQAIALGDGRVGEAHVTEMLGLADRTRIFELYDAVMRGSIVEALDILSDLYAAGAEPTVVFRDLLELTHWLTRIKLVPDVAKDPSVPEAEGVRGREMAEKLSLSLLSRTWQMLMKGMGEVEAASSSLQAAEMVLIRLVYTSDLPPPIDLVRRLSDHGIGSRREGERVPSNASGRGSGAVPHAAARTEWATPPSNRSPSAALAAEPAPDDPAADRREDETTVQPRSFEEVVSLAWQMREGVLAKQLSNDVHLVHFEPGRIEFRPTMDAPRDLAGRLARLLQECTGRRWMVSVSGQEGAPVLREQRRADEEKSRQRVLEHPLVQAVLEAFPGAKVVDRRCAQEPASEATPDAGRADWADGPTGDTIVPDNGGELP